MNIVWNKEKLLQLGNEFLEQVLINMKDDNESVVCFGRTGIGIEPNYQITYSDESSETFRGRNHKHHERKSFDGKRISEPFSHDYIINLVQNEDDFFFPELVLDEQPYNEGAINKITVNHYERNPKARQICIEHYGMNCSVCDFNFEEKYGEIGEGFIHVHHLKPLSKIGREYELKPIDDLRPVCPNCHAMLHKSKPPYSIEELKGIINKVTINNYKLNNHEL